MELPCFKQLLEKNRLLDERVHYLNATIEYLESKNRRLSNKVIKYKGLYKNYKVSKKTNHVVDLVSDDDDEPIVMTIEEKPLPITIKKEVLKEVVQPEVVVEEVVADDQVADDQEEEVVVEAEAEEEEAEAEEEEAEAEEAEAEEEEVVDEVVEEEGQEEEEEEVADDQEEAEEEEEEEVADDQEAEEEEEAEVADDQEEEEEEAEVYEVVIKGKTYYVQNEKDGPIYEADENGDISLEVGVYKNGKPVFF